MVLSQPGRRGASMFRCRAGSHTARGGFRRAVARLLIAALVVSGSAGGERHRGRRRAAYYSPAPPSAPSSCEDSIRSGAYPTASTGADRALATEPRSRGRGPAGGRRVCSAWAARPNACRRLLGPRPTTRSGDGSTLHDAQLDPPDLYLRGRAPGNRLPAACTWWISNSTLLRALLGCACSAVVVPKSQRQEGPRRTSRTGGRRSACLRNLGAAAGLFAPGRRALWTPSNQAPYRWSAGADQGIEQGAAAELDGSVTDDGQPAPGTLTIAWSEVSGPAVVARSGRRQSAKDAGALSVRPALTRLRLTASDGALSSFDEDAGGLFVAANACAGRRPRDPTSRSPSPSDDRHPPRAASRTTAACSRAPRFRGASSAGRLELSSASRGAPPRRSRCPAWGIFELRLSAFDGQLSASDVVRVTVAPEPPPGRGRRGPPPYGRATKGLTGASVEVRLFEALGRARERRLRHPGRDGREPVRLPAPVRHARVPRPGRRPARCSCPWSAITRARPRSRWSC